MVIEWSRKTEKRMSERILKERETREEEKEEMKDDGGGVGGRKWKRT